MDFRLTDEQQEWKDYCRRFAREVMRPVAPYYDREQKTPWDVIKEARKWDLHGLDYIQKMGTDPEGMLGVIYAEELHWGCAGIALAISAGSLAAAARAFQRAAGKDERRQHGGREGDAGHVSAKIDPGAAVRAHPIPFAFLVD